MIVFNLSRGIGAILQWTNLFIFGTKLKIHVTTILAVEINKNNNNLSIHCNLSFFNCKIEDIVETSKKKIHTLQCRSER